jgi:hypothetical protein
MFVFFLKRCKAKKILQLQGIIENGLWIVLDVN